jgi:hypothetical protein
MHKESFLDRLRLRGLWGAIDEFLLAATARQLKPVAISKHLAKAVIHDNRRD